MLSRNITQKVIYMLLLSMVMVWVGHSPALFAVNGQQEAVHLEHPHSHITAKRTSADLSNPVSAEHSHLPFTADHVHEPFHMYAPIALVIVLVRSMPNTLLDLFIPSGPVFPFERPPRS